jgi:hypothetical protein
MQAAERKAATWSAISDFLEVKRYANLGVLIRNNLKNQ